MCTHIHIYVNSLTLWAYAVFELMVIYEDNGDPPISATLIMLLQL